MPRDVQTSFMYEPVPANSLLYPISELNVSPPRMKMRVRREGGMGSPRPCGFRKIATAWPQRAAHGDPADVAEFCSFLPEYCAQFSVSTTQQIKHHARHERSARFSSWAGDLLSASWRCFSTPPFALWRSVVHEPGCNVRAAVGCAASASKQAATASRHIAGPPRMRASTGVRPEKCRWRLMTSST
jgi:hypothetical protein